MRKGFNFRRSFLASGKKGCVCVAKKRCLKIQPRVDPIREDEKSRPS